MRNTLKLFIILGIILCLASCADKKPVYLTIANVALSEKTINPAKGQKTKIRYYLSKSTVAKISICDSGDRLARTISSGAAEKKGYNEKSWDGKDIAGNALANGVYTYIIEALDPATKKAVRYSPLFETAGKELTLRGLEFDNKTGVIEYVLPKAASLRIRVGMKDGGPLLRTLVDWEPQEAGRHTIKWDGKDSSRELELLGNPNVYLNLTAFSLAENSIIVKGDGGFERTDKSEPGFDFEILDVTEYHDSNIPLIRGDNVSIRVSVAEEDKMDLINSRFEIIFFMDNVFLFEEEEGTSPFTYRLDIKKLNKGLHALTVNIYSYNDRTAGRTKKIFIYRSN